MIRALWIFSLTTEWTETADSNFTIFVVVVFHQPRLKHSSIFHLSSGMDEQSSGRHFINNFSAINTI